MSRSVEDTSILLRALVEPQRRDDLDRSERHASEQKVFRIGVADNARADGQVARVYATAVEALRTLGHHIVKSTAPFDIPGFDDLRTIDVDRHNISDRAFQDIDILVSPTLKGPVLEVD